MYSFEIFVLDRETMCHKFQLHASMRCFDDYNDVLARGRSKAFIFSMQIPNTLIELNIWDKERKEFVEEIVFENGVKIN